MQQEFRSRKPAFPYYGPSEWIARLRTDRYVRALIDTRGDDYAQNAVVVRQQKRVLFCMRVAARLKMWRVIWRGVKAWSQLRARRFSARVDRSVKATYLWAKKQVDSHYTIK